MRLVLCSIFVCFAFLISRIDAEQRPNIVVLGTQNNVISRGINARVSVSNDGHTTTINSNFGNMEIDNSKVDRNGYVVEGNHSLDPNRCGNGELSEIVKSCDGKLAVRVKTPQDDQNFVNYGQRK